MRKFKIIDLAIQLVLIIAMMICLLFEGTSFISMLLTMPFGLWQVISSMVHIVIENKKVCWRRLYFVAGAILLCILFAKQFGLIDRDVFLIILVSISAFMGIFYLIISIVETRQFIKK